MFWAEVIFLSVDPYMWPYTERIPLFLSANVFTRSRKLPIFDSIVLLLLSKIEWLIWLSPNDANLYRLYVLLRRFASSTQLNCIDYYYNRGIYGRSHLTICQWMAKKNKQLCTYEIMHHSYEILENAGFSCIIHCWTDKWFDGITQSKKYTDNLIRQFEIWWNRYGWI